MSIYREPMITIVVDEWDVEENRFHLLFRVEEWHETGIYCSSWGAYAEVEETMRRMVLTDDPVPSPAEDVK